MNAAEWPIELVAELGRRFFLAAGHPGEQPLFVGDGGPVVEAAVKLGR